MTATVLDRMDEACGSQSVMKPAAEAIADLQLLVRTKP